MPSSRSVFKGTQQQEEKGCKCVLGTKGMLAVLLPVATADDHPEEPALSKTRRSSLISFRL